MSQENAEVVRRAFDTFMPEGSVSDISHLLDDFTDDALKEYIDPEVELLPIPQGVLAGGEYVGFEGLRRFWADFFGAWDEIHVEPLEFREASDLVVSIWAIQGTDARPRNRRSLLQPLHAS
jgi:SnoaL-like domain